MASNEPVTLERDAGVGIIRLDSEKTRNALSNEMRAGLERAFAEVARDREVKAVYLGANGANFCAGGDLRALSGMRSDGWAVHRRFRDMGRWLLPFMRLEKPVVVGVRGHAVGGGFGLALAGDVVIASETAKFSASWMRLGVMPDALTLYTLPRLIGLAAARKLFITEAELSAEQALALDLAAEVVPDAELDARAMGLARRLAEGPAEAWGLTKLMLLRSFESSMDDMFLFEGLGQVVAMGGPDFGERAQAFLDKRRPPPSMRDAFE